MSENAKEPRLATLTRPMGGKFTKWEQGEVVKAHHVSGSSYCIEKLKRKPSGFLREGLPLLNELAGVPRSALVFHDQYEGSV